MLSRDLQSLADRLLAIGVGGLPLTRADLDLVVANLDDAARRARVLEQAPVPASFRLSDVASGRVVAFDRARQRRAGRAIGATLAGLLLWAGSAAAAEPPRCGPRAVVLLLLEQRFGEWPAQAGLSATGQMVELFASADGATWSLVVTAPNGTACVTDVGESWTVRLPPGEPS
jgi:hypothetical protein